MKQLSQILLSVSLLSTLLSCSSDNSDDLMIWDIYPTGITIRLVDADGRNLLDPDVEGNWVGCPMHIGYEDQAYSTIWDRESIPLETRACMPIFYGLVWDGAFGGNADHYGLNFGQFDGAENHHIVTTFSIEELNTVYEIVYDRKFEWKKNEPHSTDYIYLNGKKSEGCTVKIVLPPHTSN